MKNYYGTDADNYVLAKCSGDNYLEHKSHKYIKREWKNGKWRYYYNSKSGKTRDLKALSKLADWYGEDENTNKELTWKMYDELDANDERKRSAFDKATDMTDRYLKTPKGKIDYAKAVAEEIYLGIKYYDIPNLKKSASKAINKGASSVKRLLGID